MTISLTDIGCEYESYPQKECTDKIDYMKLIATKEDTIEQFTNIMQGK